MFVRKAIVTRLLLAAAAFASLCVSLPTASQAQTGTQVKLGATPLGRVLVAADGLSLYMYTRDTQGGPSVCYDRCAVAWPPLYVDGALTAAAGVDQALLGTTTRKDGKLQATYNGWPLYYWYLDNKPGEVKGQDVGKVWYVLNAAGALDKRIVSYVGQTKSPLGEALIGPNGRALYLFTKDAKNVSNCYDACATAWPPLLTDVAPQADSGVKASLLGTTKRKDGKLQVTYAGQPVYYFVSDKASGDWTGQGVGDVWWMLKPTGAAIKGKLPVIAKVSAGKTIYGDILVDQKGRSVYMFTKDTNGESACYDKCAVAWPPVLTEVAPTVGTGAKAELLGTVKRKDGSLQVTYNKMPLYYYVEDAAAGDLKGQNVNSVWFVLRPTGEVLMPQ